MYYIEDNRENGKNEIEQARLVMVKMLKIFALICEEHNLTYWLDFGTLLGAVRHGGFIPWDDDLDVTMPRNDYNRFKKIAPKLLPLDVHFQTHSRAKGNRWKFVKLRDKYSTFITVSDKRKHVNYHRGIFIDIFPCDYTAKSIKTKRMWLHRRFQFSNRPTVAKYGKLLNILALFPVKIIGYKLFYYLLSLSIKTPKHKQKLCSCGLDMNVGYTHVDIPLEYLFPLQKIKFESGTFYAPKDLDAFLTCRYQNYMTIPDKKDRAVHAHAIYPFTPCKHKDTLNWKDRTKDENSE